MVVRTCMSSALFSSCLGCSWRAEKQQVRVRVRVHSTRCQRKPFPRRPPAQLIRRRMQHAGMHATCCTQPEGQIQNAQRPFCLRGRECADHRLCIAPRSYTVCASGAAAMCSCSTCRDAAFRMAYVGVTLGCSRVGGVGEPELCLPAMRSAALLLYGMIALCAARHAC